jgi:hypothetical protein
MTIMMLGVVQIFTVITETAARAQGFQFFQEQGRALLNRMDLDIRGLTREGYLRIVTSGDIAGVTQPAFSFSTPAGAFTLSTSGYASDLLAMTTVGPVTGVWSPTGTQPPMALASEVVYTRNVRTYSQMLQVQASSKTTVVDDRRGILGRGVWLMAPKSNGTAGAGTDTDDLSAAKYLGSYAGDPTTNYRRAQNFLTVSPLTGADGLTAYSTPGPGSPGPPSLQRVAASCDSEFLVEYLTWIKDPSTGGTAYDYYWVRGNQDFRGHQDILNSTKVTCPRAIRITLAIHDPDDRAPLTGSMKPPRFQGLALQEVFWIGDP